MQKIRQNYNHTLYASYFGYITQAIVNTFIPLLFLTFQSSYQISLDKITSLVTINFGIQLIVDLLSTKWVDRIGYRCRLWRPISARPQGWRGWGYSRSCSLTLTGGFCSRLGCMPLAAG